MTRPASCLLKSTPLSTTATVTPLPWVSGQTPLKSRTFCAQGTAAMRGLASFTGQSRVGRGAAGTGTGIAGGCGLGLAVGLGDAVGVGVPAADAPGACPSWAPTARARPSTAAAIRLMRAASMTGRDKHIGYGTPAIPRSDPT